MEIDEIDKKILFALKERGRDSIHKISKRIGTPITTVHNRIKRLERSGVIEGYSAILNQEKLGNLVAAYILLKGDLNYLQNKKISPFDIMNNLRKKEFIEDIDSTTGHYDYVLKLRVKNMKDLSQILLQHIRMIPGLHSTETLIVLDEHR